jgi:hypothetical protein
VLPPDVVQQFVPRPSGSGAGSTYKPMLLGAAQVHFVDAKTKLDTTRDVVVVTDITNEAVPVNWDSALAIDIPLTDLEPEPPEGAMFAETPPPAAKPRNYTAWTKEFTTWVFQTERVALLKSPGTGLISSPGESERDFRIRLQQSLREERDAKAEALRRKYASKFSVLEDRLRRAQQAQEREEEQVRAQQMSTAISVGSTLLGALFGRKTFSAANVGRAGSAVRSAGRSYKEGQDVQRAAETVMAVQQQIEALDFELQTEFSRLHSQMDPAAEKFETLEIRPKKTNINVKLLCLAWVPEEFLSRV